MHLTEFKAWFKGYTEEMAGTPNKAQWAKIKKHVDNISADYTPAPVFIERYYEPWRRYWYNTPIWSTTNAVLCSGNAANTNRTEAPTASANIYNLSAADWTEAGRAEFRAGV